MYAVQSLEMTVTWIISHLDLSEKNLSGTWLVMNDKALESLQCLDSCS